MLSTKLSTVFDQVTALGRTYLGIDFHDTGGVYRPADAAEADHAICEPSNGRGNR